MSHEWQIYAYSLCNLLSAASVYDCGQRTKRGFLSGIARIRTVL